MSATSTGRASQSANWRNSGTTSASSDSMAQLAQLQQQQQQFMVQQQELYNLHQAQMELQLKQLQLQNLEIQERIYASNPNQDMVNVLDPQAIKRRSALLTGLNLPLDPYPTSQPHSANYQEQTFAPQMQVYDEPRGGRRGALQHALGLGQQRPQQIDQGLPLHANGSRLSFSGGEGLAERALARKHSGILSPPLALPAQSALSESTSTIRTHHRSTSSIASSASSQLFSEGNRQVSPPHGPTLVLSQPGEAYPMNRRSHRLTVGTREAQLLRGAESSESSSPGASDTDSSEVASFESITSVGSQGPLYKTGIRAVSVPLLDDGIGQKTTLNPSASTFNPSAPAFTPGSASAIYPKSKRDSSSSLGLSLPSTMVNNNVGYRNFTAPPALMGQGVYAIRQPKGPAREDEMEAKNFSGRIRRRAVTALKFKSRNSFGGGLTSPTFLAEGFSM